MAPEYDYGYPCRLYLISPPTFDVDMFEKQLQSALEAGDVGAFQLRMKDATDADALAAAERLLPHCREHEVAFILNDRPDIAFKVGADGVHLGQEDLLHMPVAKAREILGPDAVIGVSCHDSSDLAMQAGEMGADYVAFGAFFPTQSKAPEKLAKYGTPKTDTLTWWYQYTVLPCVAIGGMTPENCPPIVAAGADFIAAIQGVWNHKDGPAAAVIAFNDAIKSALKDRMSLEAA